MKPTHYEIFAKQITEHMPKISGTPTEFLTRYLKLLWDNITFGDQVQCGKESFGQELLMAPDLEQKLQREKDGTMLRVVHRVMVATADSIMGVLLRYRHHGCKTFNVSRGLSQALMDTDMSGTYEYLKLPFESFLINWEHCPVNVTFRDEAALVSGVYVSTQCGRTIFSATSDTGLWSRSCITLADVDPKAPIDVADFRHGDQGTWNPAVELAIKVLLYMNSDAPDVKKGDNGYIRNQEKLKKAKEPRVVERLKKFGETISSLEYFDVGSSIKLKHSSNACDELEKVAYDGGFYYTHRFWVRGHFRNQACGKGHADHRMKWIQPYMKGPDQAAVVHRNYRLEV